MKRPLLAVLLLLLALPSALAAQRRAERLFYYVDTEDSWASFQAHVDQMDVVAPDAFKVDEDGFVWGDVDPRVPALAKKHGVKVVPLVVNPGFDQEKFHRFLQNDDARNRAISSIVELCRRGGYDGIQFDFEDIGFADRDAYTSFVQQSADALHGAGCELSLAVVHRPDDLPGPTRYHEWLFKNWRAGYDLAALGKAVDFISIMSYSQHTRRTPPGPQAGLPWVEAVARYFLRFVPAEKLSLGIPTGSQHWYTSQEDRIAPEMARSYSEQLSHARALTLIERNGGTLQWDDQAGVPFAHYSRGGTWEWIFLEDARSFKEKLGVMDRLGLRGFSVWVLGPEDPGIWKVLGSR